MTGSLVFVVGASGVGKDTILARLRDALCAQDRVVVAHRYITRPAGTGSENHVALSDQEFGVRLANGCFALHWESHGLGYGIGREVEDWLANGLNVLVNGSRAAWPEVRVRFPDARLVEITASEETILRRMVTRGRDSDEQLAARLQRNRTLASSHADVTQRIANDGAADQAVSELLRWLRAG